MNSELFERAEVSWAALLKVAADRDRRGAMIRRRSGGPVAFLWPYSQVLHAAVLLGELRADSTAADLLGRGLERYRVGSAYCGVARPRPGWRFYDDNAWVGLAAAQAKLFGGEPSVGRLAARVSRWVNRGQGAHGGVRWREFRGGWHACSTGSAAVLSLRVNEFDHDSTRLVAARRAVDFLHGRLARPDGLIGDNLRRGDQFDPTAFTYNQGLAIGAGVLLSRTGDDAALARAQELAQSTITNLDAEARWGQPPSFNAVLYRMLLLLHSADGDERWVTPLDEYLDRAWTTARNHKSGLFGGGGLGHYDHEVALDQAAFVQLFAARGLPRARWADLC